MSGKIPRARGQPNLPAATTEARVLEPELCNKRGHRRRSWPTTVREEAPIAARRASPHAAVKTQCRQINELIKKKKKDVHLDAETGFGKKIILGTETFPSHPQTIIGTFALNVSSWEQSSQRSSVCANLLCGRRGARLTCPPRAQVHWHLAIGAAVKCLIFLPQSGMQWITPKWFTLILPA